MIVITDSNIIFSALFSPNRIIAKILKTENKIQFFAPSFLLEEVKNHVEDIKLNSGLSSKELKKELTILESKIKFISIDKIPKKYILEAIEIVKDIDIDDTFFVALNRYKRYKIWTGDKVLINGLEKKGYKICITTSELKTKIYKKA